MDENLSCDISFLRVPLIHIDSRVEISVETPIMVSASNHVVGMHDTECGAPW